MANMDLFIFKYICFNPLAALSLCFAAGIIINQVINFRFPTLSILLYTILGGLHFCIGSFVKDIFLQHLLILFVIRYYRLLVGIVAYFCHKSVPISNNLAVAHLSGEVTAVLPTVNPQSTQLVDTIRSVCAAGVDKVIVVLPSREAPNTTWLNGHEDLIKYRALNKIVVAFSAFANKRHQIRMGLSHINTEFVALVDDHVIWPNNFLDNCLAPFENDSVGGVATWKRVRRNNVTRDVFQKLVLNLVQKGLLHAIKTLCYTFSVDFCNFLGCLYLERHHFDVTASHAIDGGMFVISGRTALYRSDILCDPEFLEKFCNETWLCGMVGPLNADDDNFITRWLICHGKQIAWQHGVEATMETTIGEAGFKTFHAQCLRWVRTTWRSNTTLLFAEGGVWLSQPWSIYAVYLTSLINFAIFTDSALLYFCYRTGFTHWYIMGAWIFLSKLVKTLPHFVRHPYDVVYLPFYILFGYYHSFLKLYALLTCWETTWGSRPESVE